MKRQTTSQRFEVMTPVMWTDELGLHAGHIHSFSRSGLSAYVQEVDDPAGDLIQVEMTQLRRWSVPIARD